MSKILKASNIVLEDKNIVNIEVPKISRSQIKREHEARIERKNLEHELANITPEQLIMKAKEEADAIVKKAEEEAVELLKGAKEEAELHRQEIFVNAKEQGYTEGYNEGYEKGAEEAEKLKKEAGELFNSIAIEKQETLEAVEGEIVDVIVKLTDKILTDCYRLNSEIILVLVKQGLANATVAGDIRVHISPDDYEMVLKNKNEIISMTDGTVDIEVIKDFSLNEGDCVIETPFGDIDSSLEQQFKNLKQSLYYIFENR